MTRGISTAIDNLEITEDPGEEGTILRLRGRISIDSSPAFRDRLLALLRGQSPRGVIVDLTDVPYIDTSGIATLIEGLKVSRNGRVPLSLRGLQGRLLHLFQVTGVLALFEMAGCLTASSSSRVS